MELAQPLIAVKLKRYKFHNVKCGPVLVEAVQANVELNGL